MQGEALEETVEGVSTSISEVRAEAVTANIFHLVLVWEGGDSALWVFAAEVFIEENKVGKATANFDRRT